MTQQVIHCRAKFPSVDTLTDLCSFGITLEATGSDTTLNLANVDQYWNNVLHGVLTGMSQSLSAWMSNRISRVANAITVEYTDITDHLDGSNAGSPFHTFVTTMDAAAFDQSLPVHDSICIGYRASYSADIEHGPVVSLPSSESAIDQGAPATHSGQMRPRARDRGRVYLGPFIPQALAAGNGQISATLLADLAIWANATFNDQQQGAADQFSPVVWSRRAATVKEIEMFYIDEGWCTQRRRGDTTANRVHSWQTFPDFLLDWV